jgi:hypothetical protein
MNQQQHDQDAEARFQARTGEREARLEDSAKGIIDFTEMMRRDSRREMIHPNLNRRTWLELEDHILKSADNHDLKVSVFTGPLFRADDMSYRGKYQLPAEFWKVVVMVKPGRKLSATAYLHFR